MENPVWPQLERSKSLKDKSYEVIKNMILTGQLNYKTIYNEKTIAKLMGVSRTPVREAMLELSKENMVTYLPGKGLIVNLVTKKQIQEVYEIRKVMEALIIDKICNHIGTKEFKKLDELIKVQTKYYNEGDEVAFIETDKSFHLHLASFQDNEQIISILLNLRDQQHLMGIKAVKNNKKRMLQVINEHKAIINALKKGDQKRSHKAVIQHLNATETILLDHV